MVMAGTTLEKKVKDRLLDALIDVPSTDVPAGRYCKISQPTSGPGSTAVTTSS
jgi:hypothetical protein